MLLKAHNRNCIWPSNSPLFNCITKSGSVQNYGWSTEYIKQVLSPRTASQLQHPVSSPYITLTYCFSLPAHQKQRSCLAPVGRLREGHTAELPLSRINDFGSVLRPPSLKIDLQSCLKSRRHTYLLSLEKGRNPVSELASRLTSIFLPTQRSL